jgi:hypothetical protein
MSTIGSMLPARALRTALVLGMMTVAAPALAQEMAEEPVMEEPEESGPATSGFVILKQDTFFGYHNIAGAGVELADGIAFTMYGILWTTPSFAAGAPSGFGLWTEFGAGASFSLLDDTLGIAPQIGILNGVLLSSAGRGVAFEGIVPNVTVAYSGDLIQAELYAGYYLGLREESPNEANDFLHYWVNAGVKITEWLAIGAHFENLLQTRGGADGTNTLYAWLGPYVEISIDDVFLRFSAGVDLQDRDAAQDGLQVGDFYQAQVGMSFD